MSNPKLKDFEGAPGESSAAELISAKSGRGVGISYNFLMDSLNEGIAIIDDSQKFIYMNSVTSQLLDADNTEEMLGKSVFDVIDPEYHELIMHQVQKRRYGLSSQYEISITTRLGNKRFLNLEMSAIMADGEFLGALAKITDISPQKKLIDTYHDNIQRFNAIVDNIGVGISVVSPEMKILSMNKQMMVWNPDLDVSCRPTCYKAFNTPARESVCNYCPVVKSLADGKAHEAITETPTPNGITNFRLVSAPIKNAKGEIVSVIEIVSDVTAEISQRNEIKRQMRFLETMINTIPSPVFYKDRLGKYLGCNRAFLDYFINDSIENIIGKKLSNLSLGMSESELAYHGEIDNLLLSDGKSRHYIADIKCADGRIRNFHVAKAIFHNAEGDTGGIIGVLVDITEKTNIENELRLQTKILGKRLKELNCLYEFLTLTNDQQKILDQVVAALLEIIPRAWQYPEIACVRIELIGHDFSTANYKSCPWKLVSAVSLGEEIYGEIEVGYLESRPENNIGPFYNEEKALLDVIAAKMAQYIERKKLETDRNQFTELLVSSNDKLEMALAEAARAKKLLSQTINRYTAMINTVPAVMYLKDRNNNYLEVNKAFCALSGRPKDKIIGFEDFKVLQSSMASRNHAEDKDILAKGNRIVIHEQKIRNSVGEERWYSTTKCPLYDENGNIAGVVGMLQDVTERILSRQKLIQSDKLAAIGQLAAGVAHEINNPIGYINSNLSFMKKSLVKFGEILNKAGDEHSALRDEMLEIITDFNEAVEESAEGTDRVKNIVADLKSFSRVDRTVREQADINEGLKSTLNVVWNELKYKAKVTTNYGDIPPVYCMANQINQVFMNILVNAAHAIRGPNGEITISTSADKDFVYVSIKDNGVGIPEENMKKIFEPFFTTKDVGKGTGLGLSLAYDIIKKHGGLIDVDSKVGQGSEFIISIPLNAVFQNDSEEGNVKAEYKEAAE